MQLPTSVNKSQSSRTVDPSGGANQVRVRAYNERLVLSLVRRHGELAKAEIARRSGLSAQTASVIMRSLETDGLLLRGKPRRGKVGQPSVPMMLNPDGAYSFGIKIGRRSADLVLVDFLGQVRETRELIYRWPEPEKILEFAKTGIDELRAGLAEESQRRVAGVGIAMPFELWNWPTEVGAPVGQLDVWRNVEIDRRLAELTGLSVLLQNDATSACGAELAFGLGAELTDFVYFYIGTFVGGGIVLNHALYAGRSGNAGALGSMPARQESGPPSQLIKHASIFELERQVSSSNTSTSPLLWDEEDWRNNSTLVDEWINVTAYHLALAVVSSCSVIDFEAAVIDGAFPASVRDKLVNEISRQVDNLDLQGIERPKIHGGTIGKSARAIGGASQPLFDRFLLDQSVLFKEIG